VTVLPKFEENDMNSVGNVYQRSGVWYVYFTHRGRRYRESSGSSERRVAVALLKRRIAEVIEGRVVGHRADRVTFADLVSLIESDYTVQGRKSLPLLKYRLTRLKTAFGSTRPVDTTYKMLSAYVEKRLGEGAAAATVRYEIVTLGRMFTLAMKAGLLPSKPPMPTVKVRNARQGFFEADELARVLTHLPEPLRPLIEFLSITGLRIGEAKALTWAQVDLDHLVVRLEPGTTKNDEGRTWPFDGHRRLATILLDQLERTLALQKKQGRIISHVFHSDGEPVGEFKKSWATACKAAGLPGKLVHDLRRTAVRNLVRAGVTEVVAMRLSGHRTRSVFQRYDIVSTEDLRDAVKKLGRG
jgi:integrase